MHRSFPVIAILGLAFVAVSAFDLLRETGPIHPVDQALDVIEKLLLLGAMAAVAWSVLKVRDLRDGQTALKYYLNRSMAQGEA